MALVALAGSVWPSFGVVAVVRRIGAQDDALGVEQRVKVLDLIGPDQVHLDVEVLELALDVLEPLHLVRLGGQAHGAAAVPAGRLPRLLLQGLVQPDAVVVQCGHAEAADEVGDQTRRVPGRTRGELALLHQHDVRPAFLGQVIEQAGPHGPAADHHHPCLCFHVLVPSACPTEPWPGTH
jgi:hypothetical protein